MIGADRFQSRLHFLWFCIPYNHEADASQNQGACKDLPETQTFLQHNGTDHNACDRFKDAEYGTQAGAGILYAILQANGCTDIVQERNQRNDPQIRQNPVQLERTGDKSIYQSRHGHGQADVEGQRLPVFLQDAGMLHINQLEGPGKNGQYRKQYAHALTGIDTLKKKEHAQRGNRKREHCYPRHLLAEQQRVQNTDNRRIHKMDGCGCTDRKVKVGQIQENLCCRCSANSIQCRFGQISHADFREAALDAACEKQEDHPANPAPEDQRTDRQGLLCCNFRQDRAHSIQHSRCNRKQDSFYNCFIHTREISENKPFFVRLRRRFLSSVLPSPHALGQ